MVANSDGGAEQRRHKRYRVKVKALVVMIHEKTQHPLIFVTENISRTGALIRLDRGESASLANLSEFQLVLQLPAIGSSQHEITCKGKVVHARAGGEFGVTFTEISEANQRVLTAFINEYVAEFPEALI